MRRLISEGGSTYARVVLGLHVRDLTGGFKCFRREMLEAIHFDSVRSQGYAFQVELTYRAVRAGFAVVEVPIVFRDRQEGQSKMSWRIAAEAMWLVPRLRYGRQPPVLNVAPPASRGADAPVRPASRRIASADTRAALPSRRSSGDGRSSYAFAHGLRRTRSTLRLAAPARPRARTLGAGSLAAALGLLARGAGDRRRSSHGYEQIISLSPPFAVGDTQNVTEILGHNLLVLALHAMACVAGFIAGSSLPLQAESHSGVSRWVHEHGGRLAIGFVVCATTFSLSAQAYVLGAHARGRLGFPARLARALVAGPAARTRSPS